MVIGLALEEQAFEQDIRELLMAFYPGAVFLYGSLKDSQKEAEEKGEPDIWVSGVFLEEKNKYCLSIKPDKKMADEKEEEISLVLQRGLKEAEENLPFAIVPLDRTETKNRIKRRLYFLLVRRTKKQLPWGALTGIRPVKIPEEKLARGWKDEDILSFMEEQYLTGEKKRRLSLEIAREERRLLSKAENSHGCSLYVGIPFCPTTCLYCSFPSYPIAKWSGHLEEYLDCLEREILFAKKMMEEEGKQLQTIYIGGGTPTSLPGQQLERLMKLISQNFNNKTLAEFTVEAGRPDSITREKLQLLKDYGATRISINPQSMNQKTLEIIGRRHTVEQVREVFFMARSLNFDNINMDIILGLPGEFMPEAENTLKEIRRLNPESLTVHCLALKRAARLNLEKEKYSDYPMASAELMDELTERAAKEARAMGMLPYYLYRQKNMAGNLENIGYAREDKGCLYNIFMMEEKQTIIACGAGSTSKRVYPDGRIERCENVKDVASFIERIDEMIERKRKLLED